MDFLRISDVGVDGLRTILDATARVKANPAAIKGLLAGTSIGVFFEKPSTRTRVSCEVAAVHLGAHPVMLRGEEVGLGKREASKDVARVLDRYVDALAFRVFRHQHLEELAEYAHGPVINLLSDIAHPCQAVADLATIAEHMALPGCRITYIGDGNNVCNSLLLGGAMTGMHVTICTPPGYEPDPVEVSAARAFTKDTGGSIVVTTDPREALVDANVVYTDVWTSMGQEGESAQRLRDFDGYQVDLAALNTASDQALFLHCLPAHRGEEVTDEVMEHPRSMVFDQAENRMHAFSAVLLYATGQLPQW
ncbi:Ornithine carbamoyltransferase [hydrothermal vent metagenome]|uniref:Ornithine carbamoyltransferase n=1 Tax=hydrothermal vent metagenome TaxID=652676 RepID=A0A3B0SEJ0_9ZZZZ